MCIWIKALPRQSRFFVGVSHRRARDVWQNSISLLSQRRRMIVLEWINEAPATNMHAVRLECTRSPHILIPFRAILNSGSMHRQDVLVFCWHLIYSGM